MHTASTIYIFNEPGQEQNQIKCVMGSAKNLIPKSFTMKKQTHKPKAGKSPSGFEVPNSSPAMEREREREREIQ